MPHKEGGKLVPSYLADIVPELSPVMNRPPRRGNEAENQDPTT